MADRIEGWSREGKRVGGALPGLNLGGWANARTTAAKAN